MGADAQKCYMYSSHLRRALLNIFLHVLITSRVRCHYNDEKLNVSYCSYCATFEITETRKACNSRFAKSWVASFEVGQRVCVECQSSAMKSRLGGRCKGEGVYEMDTKWNAVTVPGCHGMWKKVTQHQECECDARDDHSFILI